MLQRVEKHIIINDDRFDEFTFLAKNLYNYANYLIRQHFFETSKMLKECQ